MADLLVGRELGKFVNFVLGTLIFVRVDSYALGRNVRRLRVGAGCD
jgi:hypothetical protein